MDPSNESFSPILLPAIIAGFFSFVAAVVAAIITAYHSDLIFVFRRRKRNIKGMWNGIANEKVLNSSPDEIRYEVTFELHQLGSRIYGNVHGTGSNGEHYQTQIKGQMEDDHFVTL